MGKDRWELEKEFKARIEELLVNSMEDGSPPRLNWDVVVDLAEQYKQPVSYAEHWSTNALEVAMDMHSDRN